MWSRKKHFYEHINLRCLEKVHTILEKYRKNLAYILKFNFFCNFMEIKKLHIVWPFYVNSCKNTKNVLLHICNTATEVLGFIWGIFLAGSTKCLHPLNVGLCWILDGEIRQKWFRFGEEGSPGEQLWRWLANVWLLLQCTISVLSEEF